MHIDSRIWIIEMHFEFSQNKTTSVFAVLAIANRIVPSNLLNS